MSDLIDRQEAIDALENSRFPGAPYIDQGILIALREIKALPSAEPEKRTEERTETHACDLIRRQDAIDALIRKMKPHDNGEGTMTIYVMSERLVKETLNDLPVAQQERCEDCENFNKTRSLIPQPERKAGRWIYGEHDTAMCDGYRCDKCGFFVPWDYKFTFIDFINDYHFCPSCGSEMRGDDGEID